MKKAFGRFRLSKSKEEEVKLIKKIELDVLTYIIEKNNSNSRIKKLVRKYPRIRNLSRKKNQTFANPLYRMLFSKMVYKVWVRYTREIMKKEVRVVHSCSLLPILTLVRLCRSRGRYGGSKIPLSTDKKGGPGSLALGFRRRAWIILRRKRS